MTDLRIFDRIAEQLQVKAKNLQLAAVERETAFDQVTAHQHRTNAKALLYTAEAILLAAKAELAALEAETHFKERAGR